MDDYIDVGIELDKNCKCGAEVFEDDGEVWQLNACKKCKEFAVRTAKALKIHNLQQERLAQITTLFNEFIEAQDSGAEFKLFFNDNDLAKKPRFTHESPKRAAARMHRQQMANGRKYFKMRKSRREQLQRLVAKLSVPIDALVPNVILE